jgi:hypothetical protein
MLPWQWVVDHLVSAAGANQKVYLVRQQVPFADNFRSFQVRFAFESEGINPKIIDGVALLRQKFAPNETSVSSFRELNFARNGEGVIESNAVKINDPNEAEYVWMILLVSGNNLPADPPSLKRFRLWRDQP